MYIGRALALPKSVSPDMPSTYRGLTLEHMFSTIVVIGQSKIMELFPSFFFSVNLARILECRIVGLQSTNLPIYRLIRSSAYIPVLALGGLGALPSVE